MTVLIHLEYLIRSLQVCIALACLSFAIIHELLLIYHGDVIVVQTGFLHLTIQKLLASLSTPLWFRKVFLELLLTERFFGFVSMTLCNNFVENAILIKASIVVLDGRPQNFVLVS